MSVRTLIFTCVAPLLWTSAARAETVEDETRPVMTARGSANADGLTPGLTGAVMQDRGIVTSTLTYNGASKDTTLDFHGELTVWGPFRLVLRVDNTTDKARPGIGGAAQFLDETKHGVAASAYFTYKAEGFTEGEGELEALVAFGKQLGPLHGTLNLAYGQDPEGNERDGELSLASHVEVIDGLFTGVTMRYRDGLGSTKEAVARDGFGGTSTTLAFDRFAVTAMVGVAMVESQEADRTYGVAGTLAIGAGF